MYNHPSDPQTLTKQPTFQIDERADYANATKKEPYSFVLQQVNALFTIPLQQNAEIKRYPPVQWVAHPDRKTISRMVDAIKSL